MTTENRFIAPNSVMNREKAVIHTNLYELTKAVSEAVPEGDDRMVALIVEDILIHLGVSGGSRPRSIHPREP